MKIMPLTGISNSKSFTSVQNEAVKPSTQCSGNSCKPHGHKDVNIVSTSGWTTLGAMVLAVVSGVKHQHKLHLASAITAVAAAAVHIGSVTQHHHAHHHDVKA